MLGVYTPECTSSSGPGPCLVKHQRTSMTHEEQSTHMGTTRMTKNCPKSHPVFKFWIHTWAHSGSPLFIFSLNHVLFKSCSLPTVLAIFFFLECLFGFNLTAEKWTAMFMYGSSLAVWKLICHSAVKKKKTKLLKGYFITHFKPVPCHLLWLIKIQPKYPWVYNMHFQWIIYKKTNLSGKEGCEYLIFWQPGYFMCRRPISFALDDVLTWAQNCWDGGSLPEVFLMKPISADIKQEKCVGMTQEWVTETDCGVRERSQAGLWLPHSRGFTEQGTRLNLIDCRNE